MSSIYTDIAAAILPILPDFSVGGSTWTVVRASGDGVSTGITSTTITPSQTLYFVRNAVDKLKLSLPNTVLATAEWLCFAATTANVAVDDLCTSTTDSTRKFRITGRPETDFGLILAPAVLIY